ncbi:MAG: PIG-L deacetylase family protein [Candidatus Bipolaricaulia bacterium]
MRNDFTYYDLNLGRMSKDIGLLFPNWDGKETLAVLSPHDDDALLGAGYAMLAALSEGAEVYIFIFCNGCAGYSTIEEKDSIVEIRKEETREAYVRLGIDEDHILRLDYDDFSVAPYLGWHLPGGTEGTLAQSLPKLREIDTTRLLIPNGYREHLDHTAVHQVGAFDGPQVGDPILVDWGETEPITSFLEYAVWGDFSPEDALTSGRKTTLRGNRVVEANSAIEQRIRDTIQRFQSQQDIIEGLIAHREQRRFQSGHIEIYLDFDPRPSLNYSPYKEHLESFKREGWLRDAL